MYYFEIISILKVSAKIEKETGVYSPALLKYASREVPTRFSHTLVEGVLFEIKEWRM